MTMLENAMYIIFELLPTKTMLMIPTVLLIDENLD